jgi:hypothetical protein
LRLLSIAWVSQHDKRTEYDYKIIFNCRKIDGKKGGWKRPKKAEKAEKAEKGQKSRKGRKRPKNMKNTEKAEKGRKRPEKAQTLNSHTSLYVLSLIKKNRTIK